MGRATPEELKGFSGISVILLTETKRDPFLTDEIYARRAAERFPPQMPVDCSWTGRRKHPSAYPPALERALFLASASAG
jgi:hypothetical protein